MNKILSHLTLLSFFIESVFFPFSCWAQDPVVPSSVSVDKNTEDKKKNIYNLDELVFPQEVKELSKVSGAIYYSTPVKNKMLIPTHIWGEVEKSGLHFIPNDTSLIKALSFAGGITDESRQDNVKVTRFENGKTKNFQFDVESGGDETAHRFILRPGDTIFVSRERFYENRNYYTSLVGVAVSLFSGFLIYRTIQKDN